MGNYMGGLPRALRYLKEPATMPLTNTSMENTTYSNMVKIIVEASRNIEYKELETLIVASIETLKRQKMKCGIDEVP